MRINCYVQLSDKCCFYSNLRFYYAVAKPVKNSRNVAFTVLAGQHKIMGSWSKGMTTLS